MFESNSCVGLLVTLKVYSIQEAENIATAIEVILDDKIEDAKVINIDGLYKALNPLETQKTFALSSVLKD